MNEKKKDEVGGLTRRDFLRWVGIGSGTAAITAGLPLRLLAAVESVENPLAFYPTRDWEKVYRDQYRYDRTFTWVCGPNDTHMCRLRAFVRNGIVIRSEQEYTHGQYGDYMETKLR